MSASSIARTTSQPWLGSRRRRAAPPGSARPPGTRVATPVNAMNAVEDAASSTRARSESVGALRLAEEPDLEREDAVEEERERREVPGPSAGRAARGGPPRRRRRSRTAGIERCARTAAGFRSDARTPIPASSIDEPAASPEMRNASAGSTSRVSATSEDGDEDELAAGEDGVRAGSRGGMVRERARTRRRAQTRDGLPATQASSSSSGAC